MPDSTAPAHDFAVNERVVCVPPDGPAFRAVVLHPDPRAAADEVELGNLHTGRRCSALAAWVHRPPAAAVAWFLAPSLWDLPGKPTLAADLARLALLIDPAAAQAALMEAGRDG